MPSVQLDKVYGPTKRAVAAGLEAYNRARAGNGRYKGFSVSVRDDAGAIRGGAACRHWHGWVFVDLLWIDEALRGQDLGTAVMREVEVKARSLGARGIHLNTYTWQARPFYEKLGFRVVGEIPDYPPGNSCYFLIKTL